MASENCTTSVNPVVPSSYYVCSTTKGTRMNIEALKELNQFTGTENYYRQPLHGRLAYSDGVKFLAENGGAYWLIDLIASYQPMLAKHRDHRLHDLQFWALTVNGDRSATVTCVADTDEPPAVQQVIP